MDLNTIWFVLVAVLIAGYAVLDGFDLGVGILHLFARDEEERQVHVAAVGPVWDGNEVWLLTAGGALFAAFPAVYATVFSGFYLALMLLLVALIGRAVSMEFRQLLASPGWRRVWDFAFGIGSFLPALLLGVAVGNILRGVPIDMHGDYTGGFFGLLNPYALLIGLLSVAFIVAHGAIYLQLKSEGAVQARMKRWAPRLWTVWMALFSVATLATALVSPWLFEGLLQRPFFWLALMLLVAAAVVAQTGMRRGQEKVAFVGSSATIVAMIGLAGASLYPRLVPSLTDLAYSLTVYNASSTPKTLGVMLVIALIGMPLVIGYTVLVYRVFGGKVRPQAGGYSH